MNAQQRHETALANARRDISEATGFDNGAEFESPEEVRAYFTVGAMAEMFGSDTATGERPSQAELDDMAETVLRHGWHCRRP